MRLQTVLPLVLLLWTGTEARRRHHQRDEPAPEEAPEQEKGFLGKFVEGLKKPTTIATALLSGNRDLLGQTLQTLFTTVDSCIGSKRQGWKDQDLGDFTTGKDSPYCNQKCYRSYFCCPPQKPDELDVKFIFSALVNGQARHTDICVKGCRDMKAIMQLLGNTDNRILWFVHGLINDVYVEPIYNQTRDALLARGFHVVLVDWHLGNRLYLQSMANVRTVGALLGQLMYQMKVTDRSVCTGFSLGAHICQEAAKYLKKRGQIIPKCEGIDPAGPGFDGCSNDIRLDKSDCTLVTVMHTSAFKNAGSLMFGQGFGTTIKSGHCDYWVNDGMDQPKCDNGTLPKLQKKLFSGMFGKFTQDLEWAWECSHYRAVYYYLSQARRDCNFIGREGQCGGGVACTRVGEDINPEENGRSGSQKVGMRGKRSVDPDVSFVNTTDSSCEEHGRDKRWLIKSAIKGVANSLGLRKKASKEEHDKEHLGLGTEHEEGDDEVDEAAAGDEGGAEGRSFYERNRFDRPSRYRPGFRDDPDEGYRSPHGGRKPGGSGRRPPWLEGEGADDREDGGYERPEGGGRRPNWLNGGSSGNGYDRPGTGGDDWDDTSTMGKPVDGGEYGGFPQEMPLMPDDTCKPSYNLDFKYKTKGRPPFC